LEELAAAPEGATIHFPFSDTVVKKLNESNNTVGYVAVLEVDRSAIVSILDRVRNLVLDWALKMEKAGILGTEFSFDAAEKAKAQSTPTMINIGTIGSFAGNLGTSNVAGDVTVRELDLNLVRTVAKQLVEHADELAEAGADETLKDRLEALEVEMRKPRPKTSIIRGLLVDVRNAIVGAAGNLMASGAIALINQVLGTGVPVP
jgi:AbiTii